MPEEEELRLAYGKLAREAMDAATDPESPDFLNFAHGMQPIVDTAFLAHAILRAPNTLWHSVGCTSSSESRCRDENLTDTQARLQ